MAESRDMPLRAQYLLENIIMAGCILGTATGPFLFSWALGDAIEGTLGHAEEAHFTEAVAGERAETPSVSRALFI